MPPETSFEVNATSKNQTIETTRVRLNDAGTYTCLLTFDDGETVSRNLTVTVKGK